MVPFKLKRLVLALAKAGLMTLSSAAVMANPQDGNVVAGNITIQQESATKLGITQTSDKGIVDWRSFSIAPNEHTQIYMPSAQSVILNRVVGQDPSAILGRLTANGQVFLVNPNGIFFGKDAQIDVAGLIASTHNIRNADFLAGYYNFSIPGKPGAAVINEGLIRVADTGIAAFVAPSVSNQGVVVAKLGKVLLASANGFTLDFSGDQLLTFLVNDDVAKTAFDMNGKPLTSFVENAGRIEAQGGRVLMTAKAAENAIHSVINQTGTIEATTVGTKKGEIILQANKGSLSVAGTLNASAPNGGDGGFIDTSGGHVSIDPKTKISTAASLGTTGQWLLDPIDYTIAASGGDITGATLASYLVLNNVEIKTGAVGFDSGDIFVNDKVEWASLNKLSLTAHHDINVNAVINTTGGSVKLRADSEGTGVGTVNFAGTGHITATNGGSVGIYYNPVSYTAAGTRSDATHSPYGSDVTAAPGKATAYMLVNDVNHLQAMNTNLSGNYALGRDIDASATVGWNGGAGFEPVGNDFFTSFSGLFNGLGHTITNLTINRSMSSGIGLFGYTYYNSIINNIGLLGGSVIGLGSTGALVGYARGEINNSYATSSVTGGYSNSVGGLVGTLSAGKIYRSYATGVVTGGESVGGLVGQINVDGGFVIGSYATGAVSGVTYVGGLVGTTSASNAYAGGSTISQSYATGSVTGHDGVGGLVGKNGLKVNETYATGIVSGNFLTNGGGLIGGNYGTVTNSYWDNESSTQSTSASGIGKNTADMQQSTSFTNWDFTNTWQINNGVSYPTLRNTSTSPSAVVLTGSNVMPASPSTVVSSVSNVTPASPPAVVSSVSNVTPASPPAVVLTGGDVTPTAPDLTPTEGQIRRNSDYFNQIKPPENPVINPRPISPRARGLVAQYGHDVNALQAVADNEKYAVFANNAYHSSDDVDLNTFAPGFTALPPRTYDDTDDGFSATAFVNSTTGEVVVAFRGTDNRNNVIEDMEIGNTYRTGEPTAPDSKLSALLGHAMMYANHIQRAYPGHKITFTGHSLGGALAMYAGLKTGAGNVVTFNSASLPYGLSVPSNVTSFTSPGDPVTDGMYTKSSSISVANGDPTYYTGGELAGGHSMIRLLNSIHEVTTVIHNNGGTAENLVNAATQFEANIVVNQIKANGW